ncbi:HTH domain-containing protein [Muricauda ruestringensis]|uniref:LexA family protein n=1 Tax=Flagellimonas ruestringensis TaxID=111501 RepID=UPI001CD29F06|nr:S24 family peptidase [Allomuricauda ruestringensis]MCA0959568.1 HTH domain-containing protein [Allomuricauda ruestringensis]
MKKLHQNQTKLIQILRENRDNPLTMIELMDELNVASTSVVHHHIVQLEKKGFLKRNPSNPRDYQLLEDPEKPITYINQYGLVECGPDGSILDGNPLDRLPIASRLLKFPSDEAFMVIAKGDSMKPYVSPGDYLIVQKNSIPKNGDTIVCINQQKAIVKTFYKNDGKVILHSQNSDFKPFLADEDFRVEGVVRNIIKYS